MDADLRPDYEETLAAMEADVVAKSAVAHELQASAYEAQEALEETQRNLHAYQQAHELFPELWQ